MPVKKILLSFVGTNDAGKLLNKDDGVILSAIKNEKFNEVILLWNDGKIGNITYSDIVANLKNEIVKKKIKVSDLKFDIVDPTDHNLIYQSLREFSDKLPKNARLNYTAAISSGTPSMQVCWILLAESGDFSSEFPLRLIKVKDPKHGKSLNIEVKLSSSLPKILRMKDEIVGLKNSFLPTASIDTSKGKLFIGNNEIDLTPIEFCYYRYFATSAIEDINPHKFSFIYLPISIMEEIYSFHEESFPNLELNRLELKKMIKDNNGIPMTTFRGVVSKINRKIENSVMNEAEFDNFKITSDGKRGAKFYLIKAPTNKLKII